MSMQTRQQRLFRRVALERLSSPERVDELMELTPRPAWLALATVAIVLVIGVAWGFLGRLPTLVKGHGILMQGTIQTVDAPGSGVLATVFVAPGDNVRPGNPVARLTVGDGQ